MKRAGVRPGKRHGELTVEIVGKLAALLGDDAFPHGRVGQALVAGEGFEPPTSGL